MMYRWTLQNDKGQLAVCGVYSSKGAAYYARLNKEALRAAKIQVDGVTILQNLTFFRFSPNENRENYHVGDVAYCKTSKIDLPSATSDIQIKFKKGTYKVNL
jgi:hypothetical protein